MTTWNTPRITETFTYSADGPEGSVTYTTNGLQGGDAGHGGYLEVAFDTARNSTTLGVSVEAQSYGAVDLDEVDRVRLRFEGDGEILSAVASFEFLADKLRSAFPLDEPKQDAVVSGHLVNAVPHVRAEVRGGERSNLKCPRCGGTYLHQGEVVVYDRSEDHPIEMQTICGNGRSEARRVEARTSGNPSARRQGLVIRFECEFCSTGPDDRIELVIAQHKGETEIGWRFDDARSDNE